MRLIKIEIEVSGADLLAGPLVPLDVSGLGFGDVNGYDVVWGPRRLWAQIAVEYLRLRATYAGGPHHGAYVATPRDDAVAEYVISRHALDVDDPVLTVLLRPAGWLLAKFLPKWDDAPLLDGYAAAYRWDYLLAPLAYRVVDTATAELGLNPTWFVDDGSARLDDENGRDDDEQGQDGEYGQDGEHGTTTLYLTKDFEDAIRRSDDPFG